LQALEKCGGEFEATSARATGSRVCYRAAREDIADHPAGWEIAGEAELRADAPQTHVEGMPRMGFPSP
jgi:hypothetical protein